MIELYKRRDAVYKELQDLNDEIQRREKEILREWIIKNNGCDNWKRDITWLLNEDRIYTLSLVLKDAWSFIVEDCGEFPLFQTGGMGDFTDGFEWKIMDCKLHLNWELSKFSVIVDDWVERSLNDLTDVYARSSSLNKYPVVVSFTWGREPVAEMTPSELREFLISKREESRQKSRRMRERKAK